MEVRRRKNTKKGSQFHSIFPAFAPHQVYAERSRSTLHPFRISKNNFKKSLILSGIEKKLPAFKKFISRQFILA